MVDNSRRTLLKWLGTATVAGSGVGTVSAAPSPESRTQQLERVGHSLLDNPEGGEAEGDVREDLDLAAVGSFLTDNGTYIVDISNPSNPVRVGHVQLANTRCADVKFHPSEPIVFRSNEPNNGDGRGGFDILDVSTPTDPTLLTHYEEGVSHGVHNVTPYGDDYLLLTGTHRGMVVIDISDFENPSEIASFQVDDHTVHDVTVRGNLAFLAHWNAGLRIVNLSDPSNPMEVAAFDYRETEYTSAHFARAHPTKDYAVVGDEISEGEAGPKHVITFDTDAGTTNEIAVFSPPQGNAVQGPNQPYSWTGHNFDFGADDESDILFSGDYKAGVQVFDLSDPSDPVRIAQQYPTEGLGEVRSAGTGGFIDTVPFTWGAKVKGSGRVYVTDFQTGFYIYELV